MISFIFLNALLFFGAFISGYLPVCLKIPEKNIRTVSIFGGGMLIGAALSVIIPEGVDALYALDTRSEPNEAKTVNKDPAKNRVLLSDRNQVPPPKQQHVTLGVCLLSGFLLMFLIDQMEVIGKPLLNICGVRKYTAEFDGHNTNKGVFITTFGLIIHSGADGIALGAAASMEQSQLQIIVFLAIILHKAPAAFGLVTYLLHSKVSLNSVRLCLALFSVAAPLAAIITKAASDSSNSLSPRRAAEALLFSGGTFLFVAASHILPELLNQKTERVATSVEERVSIVIQTEQKSFTLTECLFFLVGAIIPTLLAVLHHH